MIEVGLPISRVDRYFLVYLYRYERGYVLLRKREDYCIDGKRGVVLSG